MRCRITEAVCVFLGGTSWEHMGVGLLLLTGLARLRIADVDLVPCCATCPHSNQYPAIYTHAPLR